MNALTIGGGALELVGLILAAWGFHRDWVQHGRGSFPWPWRRTSYTSSMLLGKTTVDVLMSSTLPVPPEASTRLDRLRRVERMVAELTAAFDRHERCLVEQQASLTKTRSELNRGLSEARSARDEQNRLRTVEGIGWAVVGLIVTAAGAVMQFVSLVIP